MIKTILLDADGVAIRKRERFFSERFAERYHIPLAEIMPFFKNEMRQTFVNKADLKEVLLPYLKTWKWEGSVDEFLAYWFAEESPRDEIVIAYVQDLRAKGVRCYLATDREKYWAHYLLETTGLKNAFDGFFFSYDVGHEKDSADYFLEVSRRLGLPPTEVSYWDDDQKNVDVAQSVGIDAHFWTDLSEFKAGTLGVL